MRVLLFALAISLLTGILSGLVPALKTAQWRLSETLKEGGRGASIGRGRAQGVFVAVEMALSTTYSWPRRSRPSVLIATGSSTRESVVWIVTRTAARPPASGTAASGDTSW